MKNRGKRILSLALALILTLGLFANALPPVNAWAEPGPDPDPNPVAPAEKGLEVTLTCLQLTQDGTGAIYKLFNSANELMTVGDDTLTNQSNGFFLEYGKELKVEVDGLTFTFSDENENIPTTPGDSATLTAGLVFANPQGGEVHLDGDTTREKLDVTQSGCEGGSISWNVTDGTDKIVFENDTHEVSTADGVEYGEAQITASLSGDSGTVYAVATFNITVGTAMITGLAGGAQPTVKGLNSLNKTNGTVTLIYAFEGKGLNKAGADQLAEDALKLITAPKGPEGVVSNAVFAVDENDDTKATLTYTFEADGRYSYATYKDDGTYNGDGSFTIDTAKPVAGNIAIVKTVGDNGSSIKVTVSGLSEDTTSVMLKANNTTEPATETIIQGQQDVVFDNVDPNATSFEITLTDDTNNSSIYSVTRFAPDPVVKIEAQGNPKTVKDTETQKETVYYNGSNKPVQFTVEPQLPEGAKVFYGEKPIVIGQEIENGTFDDDSYRVKFKSETVNGADYTYTYTHGATSSNAIVVDTVPPTLEIVKILGNEEIPLDTLTISDGIDTGTATLYILSEVEKGEDNTITADSLELNITARVSENYIDKDNNYKEKEGEDLSYTYTIDPDEARDLTEDFSKVTDWAGNPVTIEYNNTTISKIVIDRKPPVGEDDDSDSKTPDVVLQLTSKADIYTGDITFSIDAKDEDSGLKSVTYWVDKDGVLQDDKNIVLSADEQGKRTIDIDETTGEVHTSVTLALNGAQEVDDINLYVQAVDNSKNVRTAKVTFSVDNVDPQVEITRLDENGDYVDLLRGYYKKAQTIRVTITDGHFDESKAGVTLYKNGNNDVTPKPLNWTQDPLKNKAHYTDIPVIDDGAYLLTVNPKDSAGQTLPVEDGQPTEETREFVIDQVAPKMTVTYEYNNQDTYMGKMVDGVLYIRNVLDVTVSISDDSPYLPDDGRSIDMSNLVAESVPELEDAEQPSPDQDGKNINFTWTYDEAGEKQLTISYKDRAENSVEITRPQGIDGNERGKAEDGKFSDSFVIDTDVPELGITYEYTDYFYDVNDTRYHYTQKNATVTLSVTDQYFDPRETSITVTPVGACDPKEWAVWDLDDKAETPYTYKSDSWTIPDPENPTTHTLTLTLKNGDGIQYVELNTEDMSGKRPPAKRDTPHLIVDSTPPEATLVFNGVDNGAYAYSDNSGETYIKFPVEAASGETTGPDDIAKIDFTLTVKDRNLSIASLGNDVAGSITDGDGNEVSVRAIHKPDENDSDGINENMTVTFTGSIEVPADVTKELNFDVTIVDLAGCIPEKVDAMTKATPDGTDGTVIDIGYNAETGKIEKTIHIDRRRPTTGNESEVPVITLSKNAQPCTTLDGGLELFDRDVTYTATITDDLELAEITYSVVDNKENNEAIENREESITEFKTLTECDIKLPVTLHENGESDNIVLSVTAVDFAGNKITYQKTIAVDNAAPRITLYYDNNTVKNERYYNQNRTATVTVTDLFLDSASLSVNGNEVGSLTESGIMSYLFDGPDADYRVSVEAVDKAYASTTERADNEANHRTVASQDETTGAVTIDCQTPYEFTVDKVVPVINVSYDNDRVRNERYYDAARTATVAITERNFSANDVTYTPSASLEGTAITAPALGGWSNGNPHVAAANFTEDGDYSFTVAFTDLAGNEAETYDSGRFTIDQTAPTVEISNIEDYSANRGEVEPVVNFEDVNFDREGYQVKITKIVDLTDREEVELPYDLDESDTGAELRFEDLPSTIENDGIYILTASITDLAGNESEATVTYSVNRKGSTYYAYDDATVELLEKIYSNQAPTLRIAEVNPDELVSYSVTVAANNASHELAEGTDYSVEFSGEPGNFRQYIYTVNPSAFLQNDALIEGAYTMVLDSEDKAGNLNSNRANERELPISFTLDATAPIVSLTGLVNGDNIRADSRNVTVSFEDGYALARVKVLLNGQTQKVLEGEELAQANGKYSFDISQAGGEQSLQVLARDAAGNEGQMTPDPIVNFRISSNWLVYVFWQIIGSTPLLIGCISGLALLVLFLILLLKRRKKDETEQPAAVKR